MTESKWSEELVLRAIWRRNGAINKAAIRGELCGSCAAKRGFGGKARGFRNVSCPSNCWRADSEQVNCAGLNSDSYTLLCRLTVTLTKKFGQFITLSVYQGTGLDVFGGRLMHLAWTVINFCLTAPPPWPLPPPPVSLRYWIFVKKDHSFGVYRTWTTVYKNKSVVS